MFGATDSPRGRPGAVRCALALAVASLLLAPAPPADAQRRADDPAARAWRAIKRVPAQIGRGTRRAVREVEEGIDGARRRPAPAPAPDPEELPADEPTPDLAEERYGPASEPAEDPAFESLFDEEGEAPAAAEIPPAAAEPAPEATAAPGREQAPTAAPHRETEAPHAALRRAVLLCAFAAALAGVALALRRRRQAAPVPAPASAPTVPELPSAATGVRPGPTIPFRVTLDGAPPRTRVLTVDGERTTIPRRLGSEPGFDPGALDARTESAVADALASADERPTPFPGGGRYELLAEIGRGGMGVVYQARDKRLDRIVALKRLPENLQQHPRAVALLLREARSAAQLNHPHIVTVYDVDHEDGAYFLTMEFLDGHPLSTLLHRRGRFSGQEVAWLGRQAAAGLAYAHERRIVHRDVKTANLFLTRDRVVKIMDFGLAKMMEAVQRRATRIGGTPDYMAPEQTLGVEVDGRADLYSLGVTMFELLTASVPFEEGDAMRHHRETPAPDPRERVADVPAALAALVLELLAKKPDERPASATDVAARLRAIEAALAPGRGGVEAG